MPVTFVNASGAQTPNGTSLIGAIPSGGQAGDLLLAVIAHRSDTAITPPSGWTSLLQTTATSPTPDLRNHIYWKWWDSGDGSFTWTQALTNGMAVAYALFRGVDPTTPFDVAAAGQVSAGQVATCTAPSITPVTAQAMLLWVGVWTGTTVTFTAPSGMTARITQPSGTNGTTAVAGIATETLGAPASTGTRVGTLSAAQHNTAALVALRPAPGVTVTRDLPLAGSASLEVTGGRRMARLGLAGAGSLDVAGGRRLARLSFAGSGSLNASGAGRFTARLHLAGSGGLDGDGTIGSGPLWPGLHLPGQGSLDAQGKLVRVTGSLALAGSASLEAQGAAGPSRHTRTLNLPGSASLNAAGTTATRVHVRTLGLAGAAALEAAGTARVRHVRTLGLAGAASLDAGGSLPGWKGVQQVVTGLVTASTYSFTVQARAPLGSATVRAVLIDAANGTTTQEQVVGSQWTPVTVSRSTGAGTQLTAQALVGPGQVADFDAAMLYGGTTPIPFRMNVSDQGEVYHYNLARNLDGTGANDWQKGDATFNTGGVGAGFIDLYSLSSMGDTPFQFIFNATAAGTSFSENFARATEWELWGGTVGLPAVNDAVYFGSPATFTQLHLTLTQHMGNAGGSLVWEYWTGAVWATTPGIAFTTGSWQAPVNTAASLGWTAPGNWATTSVNGQSAYWVRTRWSVAPTALTRPRQGRRVVSRGRRQYGPTIVGNVRNSTAYNDWSEHWAVGNLSGLYDYGGDIFGAAFGKYSPTTNWVSIDPTNGMRIMYGDVQKARYSTEVLIGETTAGQFNTHIGAGFLRLRLAELSFFAATAAAITITQPNDQSNYLTISSSQLSFYRADTQIARFGTDLVLWDPSNTTNYFQIQSGTLRLVHGGLHKFSVSATSTRLGNSVSTAAGTRVWIMSGSSSIGEAGEAGTAGDVMIGRNAASLANLMYDESAGRLNFRSGTTTKLYIDTDGTLVGGGGLVRLNNLGLRVAPSAGDAWNATAAYAIGTDASTVGGMYGYYVAAETRYGVYVQAGNGENTGLAQTGLVANRLRSLVYVSSESSTGAVARLILAANDINLGTAVYVTGGLNLGNPFQRTNTSGNLAMEGSLTLDGVITQRGTSASNNLFGSLIIGGGATTYRALVIESASGQSRDLIWRSGAENRWLLRVSADAESGSNAGSFLQLFPYTDGNVAQTVLLNLNRNGEMAFGGDSIQANQRLRIRGRTATSSGFVLATSNSSGTGTFWVRDDGAGFLLAAAWTYGSDARLKTNIRSLDYGLAALRRLRPAAFDYRAGRRDNLGFIAQEVREVLPELVEEVDGGMLGLRQEGITPVVVAAVQELDRRVDDEVAQLRREVEELRALVRKLHPWVE